MDPNELTEKATEIVREKFARDEEVITNVQLKPLSNIGNHFASKIYQMRFKIINAKNGEERCRSVIVKALPLITPQNSYIKTVAFPRELSVYSEYFPVIEQIQEKNKGTRITPEFYGDINGEVLIIEDLLANGFESPVRNRNLTIEEISLTLKKVAQFHVASAYAQNKGMLNMEKLTPNRFIRGYTDSFLKTARDSIVKCIRKNWGEESEKYAKLIEEHLSDEFFEVLVTKEEVLREDLLFVLGHLDLWASNVLFSYDVNGKPVDVRFVDFQYSAYTPYLYDVYNIIMMTLPSMSDNKLIHKFLHCYLDEMKQRFISLNLMPAHLPSIDNIVHEVERRTLLQTTTRVLLKHFIVEPQKGVMPDNVLLGSDLAVTTFDVLYSRPDIIEQIKEDLDMLEKYVEKIEKMKIEPTVKP